MFGYVNISKECIGDEDKKLYSMYYCGLCKAIGKKSQISRLALSNDLTFLAIILSSVLIDEPSVLHNKHCIAHPVKKHDEIAMDKVLDYASDMNILLVYLKVCDDVNDDRRLVDYFKKIIFSYRASRIKNKYPELSKGILENLKKLSQLEKEKCDSIDKTADCFAKILEAIFSPKNLGLDDEIIHILRWIGYNLGRWIYIIDVYADIKKDKKSGSYNPFLCVGKIDKKLTKDALLYTLANISNAYDLLKIYRNDSLIKNFLFSGLPEMQEHIFIRMEETNGPV